MVRPTRVLTSAGEGNVAGERERERERERESARAREPERERVCSECLSLSLYIYTYIFSLLGKRLFDVLGDLAGEERVLRIATDYACSRRSVSICTFLPVKQVN